MKHIEAHHICTINFLSMDMFSTSSYLMTLISFPPLEHQHQGGGSWRDVVVAIGMYVLLPPPPSTHTYTHTHTHNDHCPSKLSQESKLSLRGWRDKRERSVTQVLSMIKWEHNANYEGSDCVNDVMSNVPITKNEMTNILCR